MNAEIFPATTPEDAYKPDRQNNPVEPVDMLACLLWQAKAHLLLCTRDEAGHEEMTDVPEKYISRVIFSVIGSWIRPKKPLIREVKLWQKKQKNRCGTLWAAQCQV